MDSLYVLEVLNTWDLPMFQFVGVFSSLENAKAFSLAHTFVLKDDVYGQRYQSEPREWRITPITVDIATTEQLPE